LDLGFGSGLVRKGGRGNRPKIPIPG